MRRQLFLGGLALVAFQTMCLADTFIIYNNGPSNQDNGFDISAHTTADDFFINSPTTLTGGTFWASGFDLSFLSDFSGTIGWAIMSDNGGAPGTVMSSGIDSNPTLTNTFLLDAGTEEWQVDFSFGSVALSAGTYWLALRENGLGSSFDQTQIFWDTTGVTTGFASQQSGDITATPDPASWSSNGGADLAFQLTGTTPEPSTILSSLCAFALLAFFARRKLATAAE